MDGAADRTTRPSGVMSRGHPYWLTMTGAAEILGVMPTRVRQLVRGGLSRLGLGLVFGALTGLAAARRPSW
jgi:hypothetical protein